MPGRAAKKRKREPLEGKNKGKLSRDGRIMTCTHCHENGHNESGCPKRTNDASKVVYICYFSRQYNFLFCLPIILYFLIIGNTKLW